MKTRTILQILTLTITLFNVMFAFLQRNSMGFSGWLCASFFMLQIIFIDNWSGEKSNG
jgi:hypothetical protein